MRIESKIKSKSKNLYYEYMNEKVRKNRKSRKKFAPLKDDVLP